MAYKTKPDGIRVDLQTGRKTIKHGYSVAIYWTPDMLRQMRELYPVTLNEELAGILGVSHRTLTRKARQLGIQKDPTWLRGIWEERRRMAQMMSRALGYPGKFQKGRRAYPDGEFKKGHQESPETKEKRKASLHRYIISHKSELQQRGQKAWNTRRRNQQQQP